MVYFQYGREASLVFEMWVEPKGKSLVGSGGGRMVPNQF